MQQDNYSNENNRGSSINSGSDPIIIIEYGTMININILSAEMFNDSQFICCFLPSL